MAFRCFFPLVGHENFLAIAGEPLIEGEVRAELPIIP